MLIFSVVIFVFSMLTLSPVSLCLEKWGSWPPPSSYGSAAPDRDLRLALLYKIVTGHVAINPDQIGLVAAANRTRANHRYKFRAIGASSTGLRYSFAVRTVSDWNQLPAVVVEQENPAAFKAQLARCAPVCTFDPPPPLAWYSTRFADYSARQDKTFVVEHWLPLLSTNKNHNPNLKLRSCIMSLRLELCGLIWHNDI